MRRLISLSIIFISLHAFSVNPIGHDEILRENAKTINGKPAEEENDYIKLTGEAEKCIEEGNYVDAILKLKDAINSDPNNPSNALLYSNLGIVYSYLDQDSLALKSYNKALEIAPAMTTVLGNRGLLNLKLGRDKEAFNDFTKIIARDSCNLTARYYHGMMSLYGGDLETTTADFQVLKDNDSNGYNTAAALATLYSFTGRDKDAIPYYKVLIDEDPSPEYYAALAGCYLSISDLSLASSTVAEGFKACGEDAELYYYRALINKESYLLDAARQDAKRAIELGADPIKVKRIFE